jgi:hypothetical protein
LKFGFFSNFDNLGGGGIAFWEKANIKKTNSYKCLLGHPSIQIQKEFTFRIRLAELLVI